MDSVEDIFNQMKSISIVNFIPLQIFKFVHLDGMHILGNLNKLEIIMVKTVFSNLSYCLHYPSAKNKIAGGIFFKRNDIFRKVV